MTVYNGLLQVEEDCLACPFFMPVARLQNGNWPHAARLPLGCGWSGHCTAPGHGGEVPSRDILEAFCNLGYASRCNWAPRQSPCDAIRFAVSAPSGLAGDSRAVAQAPAAVIHIRYVCERDHLPIEHGDLRFDLASAMWQQRHADDRIQKMAECFLESYLKKKS